MVLAKLTSPGDVGRFALAIAICAPITALSTMRLRAVQVTDARDQFQFGHFLAVQLFNSTLALLIIASIALLAGYPPTTAWMIVVVGLGHAIMAVRDVFIAFNQKYERMDTVAASTGIIGIVSLVSLGLGVWWTRSLLVGVIAWQMSKLICFLAWDLRNTAKLMVHYVDGPPSQLMRPNWQWSAMRSLIWLAMPLGISAIFLSMTRNIPRYYVEIYLGSDALGYFAAILALVMAGAMVTQAATMSVLPRLSRYYLNNRRAFYKLQAMLGLLSISMGFAGLVIVWFAGEWILTLAFTSDYARYTDLFLWAMGYGVFAYTASFLTAGITAMRKFKHLLVANIVYLTAIVITGWLLIPELNLIGAVWSMIIGRLSFIAIALFIFGCDIYQRLRVARDS